MTEHYLGRDPALYDTCSPQLKREVIQEVLANFDAGVSYESCCWAADVPPEVFTRWRQEDPRLEKACRKRLALLEKAYVRTMRGLPELDEDGNPKIVDGERVYPTAQQQKMAHEALKQTSLYWAPKSAAAQLAEGLQELEKQLPAKEYGLVVSTLHKYLGA